MQKSEQINELSLALNKAQALMGGAVKDASNPFFKSRYADLPSVISACKEEMTKNGLAILQPVSSDEHGVYVETIITHQSGQWISSGPMKLLLTKQDMQALGSAISYARRYSLQSMLNIPAVDDDAESAMFRAETPAVGHPSAIVSHSSVDPEFARKIEEIVDLGKKAFNKSKSSFEGWLAVNFQTSDPMKLTEKQIEKAMGLLLDAIAAKES